MKKSVITQNTRSRVVNKSFVKQFIGIICWLGLIVASSYYLFAQLWHAPIAHLFTASQQLSVQELATQLKLLPTTLVAIMAGGLLGVASLLLQQLVKNPLASDTTLAVGSGAQMALLIVTLFLPNLGLYGNFWVALIGSLMSMGLVWLMAMPSRFNPVVLVLSGLIINIFFSALSSLMMLFFSEKSLGVMVWGGGVLSQLGWQSTQLLAITTIALPLLVVPLLKPLSLMSLDDTQAKSLGVPISTIRALVLVLVAVLVALVVSQVGVLSFVGLGAATLVHISRVRQLASRLVLGFLLGGGLLWFASNVVMMLMQKMPVVIPVGAITGILGAPLIIWVILRQRHQTLGDTAAFTHYRQRAITPMTYVGLSLALFVIIMMALGFTKNIHTGGWGLSWDSEMIYQFRLPRTLSAAATGIMLATAGVMIQSYTRNPMASPEVLGISSGSAVGVLIYLLIASLLGLPLALGSIFVGGIVGALATLWLILMLSKKLSSDYLILVGVAIGALMNGVLSLINLAGDPRLQSILSWLSGTTYSARPETVWWLIGFAIILVTCGWLLIEPLRLLSLGRSVARSLGLGIRMADMAVLLVIAGLSTATTLAVGPLSFVGLMIPHLATYFGAVNLNKQLPISMLFGAILMVMADWLGRYVIFPYEIPAGTIAAIIGGVYFMWLMRKTS